MDRPQPSPRGQPLRAVPLRPRLVERDNNLPAQLSSFVGREREVGQVGELLSGNRLLTLTGPGGIGKTRLALATAGALVSEYADGVWFVELAALADPVLVTAAVAHVFGVRGETHTPLADTLAQILRSQNLPLVLDNCEHLIDACAELITTLLQACSGIQVLATSREPLGVDGEQIWPVLPLTLPEADGPISLEQLGEGAAARLFVEQARSSLPEFRLTEHNAAAVAELCRRLDGLPLAIELAAAQVRGLPPEQLLERLAQRLRRLVSPTRGAPPRHQTLQGTIDWSYELLTNTERLLFDRLGVFSGGWTVDAAEAVVSGGQLAEEDVLPGLLRLVDKSLVVAEPGARDGVRYRLLEPVRQDALERLVARGDAQRVRDRHAAYFLELVEQLEPAFARADEDVAFDRLQRENDNLRAALGWLMDREELEHAQRLGGALWRFWQLRSHLQEGRVLLAKLLLLGNDKRSILRLKLLQGAARLAEYQGDLAATESHARTSLALARDLQDPMSVAASLIILGEAASWRGEYAAAYALYEEGVAAARLASRTSSGARCSYSPRFAGVFEIQSLWRSGLAACCLGEYALARARAEEAHARATEDGFPRLVAQALRVLGHVSYLQGEYLVAHSFLERSLEMWSAFSSRLEHNTVDAAILLGCVERELREFDRARALLSDSLVVVERYGGRQRVAQSLDAFAGLAAACALPEVAVRLAGAAEHVYASMNVDPSRVDRFDLERWLGPARKALGETRVGEAMAAGRALTRADAISEALSISLPPPRGSRHDSPPGSLTPRELEVVRLIARGCTDRTIAGALVISENTAHTHVRNILSKLKLQSRVQIAAWAVQTELAPERTHAAPKDT